MGAYLAVEGDPAFVYCDYTFFILEGYKRVGVRPGMGDLPSLGVASCVNRDWCSGSDRPRNWKRLLRG